MRMPNTDQTLDLLRNVNSLRHEGFSTKGTTLGGSGTSGGGGGGPEQETDPGPELGGDLATAAGVPGATGQPLQQQGSETSIRAVKVGPSAASFTSSTGHPQSCSASSQSEQVQHSALSGHTNSLSGSLSRLLHRHGSKSSKGSAERLHIVQLSFSDTNQLRDGAALPPPRLIELGSGSSWGGQPAGMSVTGASKSSFGSCAVPERASPSVVGSIIGKQSSGGYDGGSGSTKTWGASGFMRKFSQMTGKSSQLSSMLNGVGDPQCPLKVVRLAVRIGIATGPLPYNCEVANCAVKDKAKGEATLWMLCNVPFGHLHLHLYLLCNVPSDML
jgi:hypothetical protein